MKQINLSGAALVAVALLATGCGKEEPAVQPEATVTETEAATPSPAKDPAEVILEVNGAKLTRGTLDADVDKILAQQDIPADQLTYARRHFEGQSAQAFMVANTLAKKAAELGYTATAEDIKKREADFLKSVAGRPDAPKSIEEAAEKSPFGKERAMEEFRAGIAIEKMIDAEAVAKAAPQDFTIEAKKRIDEITAANAKLTDAEPKALAKIKALKAELDAVPEADKAAKFAELAKANSECPSNKDGGALGFFTHGQMVKEFDEAAFAMEPGKISEPVKTTFGYHLIMVTDKKPAVEAKGDQPATPEKVNASHILIKVAAPKPVPEVNQLVEQLKKDAERKVVNDYILSIVNASEIKAAPDFEYLLPPTKRQAPVASPKK